MTSSRDRARSHNLEQLRELGFRPAQWLPQCRAEGPVELRSFEEIAARFAALGALFLWVAGPEESCSDQVVRGYLSQLGLSAHLTEEEVAITELDREEANEEHAGDVGWRLENMWSLAWILGFPTPPAIGGMLEELLIHLVPRS